MGGAHKNFKLKRERDKDFTAERCLEAYWGKKAILDTWNQKSGLKHNSDPELQDLTHRVSQKKIQLLARGIDPDSEEWVRRVLRQGF